MMNLSKEHIARYSRQLILPEIGAQGQQKLLSASVLVVGAGGLGCPAALYLAAAGVGTIGLVDREAVALSNLHRQILHTTDSVGHPKSYSAQARLEALNPTVAIRAMQDSVTAATARRLFTPYDVVLDGSDNFATRYLVNDACVLLNKPLVHGGAVHVGGQVMTIRPHDSACFRCVFPEPPQPGAIPSCQEAGVVGTAAGTVGVLMAHEALKLLAGFGKPLTDRLLIFEGRTSRFREVPIRRNPACAVCGDEPTIHELSDEPAWCDGMNPGVGQQEVQWHESRSR